MYLLAVLPLPGVGDAGNGASQCALAVRLAVLKLAGVGDAIGARQGALAVALVVLPLAAVRGAIGDRLSALAVSFAVLKLAGVRGGIGKRQCAVAVRLVCAICIAGVRHAAGLLRLGVVSQRGLATWLSACCAGAAQTLRGCAHTSAG